MEMHVLLQSVLLELVELQDDLCIWACDQVQVTAVVAALALASCPHSSGCSLDCSLDVPWVVPGCRGSAPSEAAVLLSFFLLA